MVTYNMFRVWNTLQQLKVDLNVLTEKNLYTYTYFM